jgi:hypothetical protein
MVRGTARASIYCVGVLLASGLAASVSVLAQGDAATVARRYIEQHGRELGLTGADIRDVTVSSAVRNPHNDVTHVYLQQRFRGIDVHNGLLTVSVRGDEAVAVSASRFISNIASAAGAQYPQRVAAEAAANAAEHLNLNGKGRFDVLWRKGGANDATIISSAGIANRPIEASLTWVEAGSSVRLAWKVEIDEADGDHWWQALVDAETGESLGVVDLIVHDSVDGIVAATGRTAAATADPSATAIASFPPTDGARYNVFPIPLGSPTDGDRVLVSNAADPDASPFGWHDTDGSDGAEFFVTRGNNVHAYTDIDRNNVPDPDSDPSGGGTLTFDFPLDLTQQPTEYRPFAVTNLFYWNNVIHDVMHGYGFDEASGNFQVNNYGSGGLGNDDVRAEAQDGSGTNNANFGTPADGQRPRMQMFVWTHPLPNFVTVNSPAAIAGDYAASRAGFGDQLTDVGPVTGNVVLVDDGVGVTSDACEPFMVPAGAIALLDRGTCEFGLKVLNAENGGASAAIVANNAPGQPIVMGAGAVGNQVTIPSVMVTLEDGNLFKANLPVNATLRPNPLLSINRDSDLDAGVIAHEYGHGISNRLTGGPATAACLGNDEQMGEGWSDFFALVLTTDPSDTPAVSRGIGTYVIFQPRDGDGIRPTPYSTDMDINPSTYAFVANPAISQPHGIGYVWNTMLWEMYWNLVDRYGYNANVYDSWQTGGNNLAIQLVTDGLKFQPCRPGFADGRDGILAAEMALTGGTNECEIWRAFAKRGLGFSADQGDSDNRDDGVAAFDLPASCTAATFGGFDAPVANAPAINTVDAGSTVPLKFTLAGASPDNMDSQAVDCTTLIPVGEAPSPLDSPGSTGIKQKGSSYHLNWQTDSSWAGSCRRVTVRVPAASDAFAYFRFE